MKKGLWVLIVLVIVMITASYCRRRKDACAAYNRVELPKR